MLEIYYSGPEPSIYSLVKLLQLFVFAVFFQQNFGIRTAGLEEKATACQMLVCYARELKEAFAEYSEEVVKIMVPLLKFYFHDGILCCAGCVGLVLAGKAVLCDDCCPGKT